MKGAQLIQTDDGKVSVRGDLRLDTVANLVNQIDFGRLKARSLRVQLSEVKEVDSAAIALCLEWINQAHKRKVDISFEEIPRPMKRLVEMNRLNKLFLD